MPPEQVWYAECKSTLASVYIQCHVAVIMVKDQGSQLQTKCMDVTRVCGVCAVCAYMSSPSG